jgi:hypothetical protein
MRPKCPSRCTLGTEHPDGTMGIRVIRILLDALVSRSDEGVCKCAILSAWRWRLDDLTAIHGF